MRKRRLIVPTFCIIGVLVVGVAGLILYKRDPKQGVIVSGDLKPADVEQIQQDYCRLRWTNFHRALAAGDLPFLLGSIRELAFGRIREIGSPTDGCAVVHTGYVWSSRVVRVCDLTLTTNGWTLP